MRGSVVAVVGNLLATVVEVTAVDVVVDDTGTVDVVLEVVDVVVDVETGADALVETVVSTVCAAAWLTSCTCREPEGGPPTTTAPAHTAENPRSAPQVRHANRARCLWRDRSTQAHRRMCPRLDQRQSGPTVSAVRQHHQATSER